MRDDSPSTTVGTSGVELDVDTIDIAVSLVGDGGTLTLHPVQMAQIWDDLPALDARGMTIATSEECERINGGADWLGLYAGPRGRVGVVSRATARRDQW